MVDSGSVPKAKGDKRHGEHVGKGSADKIYVSLVTNGLIDLALSSCHFLGELS